MSRASWLVVAGAVIILGGGALAVFNVEQVHDPRLALLGVALIVVGSVAAAVAAWLNEQMKR